MAGIAPAMATNPVADCQGVAPANSHAAKANTPTSTSRLAIPARASSRRGIPPRAAAHRHSTKATAAKVFSSIAGLCQEPRSNATTHMQRHRPRKLVSTRTTRVGGLEAPFVVVRKILGPIALPVVRGQSIRGSFPHHITLASTNLRRHGVAGAAEPEACFSGLLLSR